MYIANHYVRINGKMYIKGERIPDGLPAEKIKWLLEADAIHEGASAAKEQETPEEPEMPAQADTADEAGEEVTKEAETADTEQEEAEEADDEAEAPEIDVMAGIVEGEAEEEPKKPTRRTSAKKQAERRKAK